MLGLLFSEITPSRYIYLIYYRYLPAPFLPNKRLHYRTLHYGFNETFRTSFHFTTLFNRFCQSEDSGSSATQSHSLHDDPVDSAGVTPLLCNFINRYYSVQPYESAYSVKRRIGVSNRRDNSRGGWQIERKVTNRGGGPRGRWLIGAAAKAGDRGAGS